MADPNPYASPQAGVAELPATRIHVPEHITGPIRHGWVAALVSGAMTLLATLVAMAGDSEDAMLGAWNLIDVAMIAALAFGIYRNSRIAATLMFAYFLASKVLIMVSTGMPTGAVLGLVFLIFYFRAMLATFRYHRYVRNARLHPPPPAKRLSDDPFFQPRQSPAEP